MLNDETVLITVSKNGAVCPIRMEENDFACLSLTPGKLIGYICFLCLSKYHYNRHLKDHISSQHVGPVICDMCGRQQDDWHALKEHKKGCSVDCGVPGCTLAHKDRNQAINHKKKFTKSQNISS